MKSFGEKVIANFLFEHDIDYKYEWRFGGMVVVTILTSRFSPVVIEGVIIEYFGLKGDPEYDAMSEDKRDYWQGKTGWRTD